MEEQKILSVAIPSYNSEDYLMHCVDTLLSGGNRIEILIVNDGSKDKTKEIADQYAKDYPDIVKAIHQENGGHGEAVNTGLKHATGKYFKVVDSDDWVDADALQKILDVLKVREDIDMLVSNFVYEKQGSKHKKKMRYKRQFPQNTVFTWEDMKAFPIGKYLLMHSVIYRTSLLKACGLQLPKHTFYVDNIFVYYPLPVVKNIYYMDVDFYRYFIGREDQSVNERVMISRLDQQMRVNKIMIETYLSKKVRSKKLDQYMLAYLTKITTVSSILAIRSGCLEHLEMKQELWNGIRERNGDLYRKMRYTLLGVGVNLPTVAGRKIAVFIYKIAQKIYGFN